jgi:hypothetical protein
VIAIVSFCDLPGFTWNTGGSTVTFAPLTVVPEALKVSVWLVTFLTVRSAVITPGMVGAFTDGRLRSIRFSESVAAAA